jgi:hypothetical protein
MIDRLKIIWNNPRAIQEAEWYILFGIFIVVWMWMFVWWT